MTDAGSLIPLEERTVDFYGDALVAALVRVHEQPEIYVPLRPICEYLGLNWSGQLQRLRRDEVLREALQFVCITHTNPAGGDPNVVCLPLEYLPGWLFGISTSRVRPDLQAKITQYRRECFRVLWQAFQATALAALESRRSPSDAATSLTHIRDMGLAIAQMADQQLALEQRVSSTEDRLDRAAQVFKAFDQRLSTVEEHIHPTAYISDAQATEIASQVKALAQRLTEHDPSKNHYQGVFAEIYRRFGVSTYKHVRQEQYAAVLTFLDEWQNAVPSR